MRKSTEGACPTVLFAYLPPACHRLAGVMDLNRKTRVGIFIAAAAIPLLVGGAAAFLARDGFGIYALLHKPPLAPPAWVFPAVWTALYLALGAASYLVFVSGASAPRRARALRVYGAQLAASFFWPFLFFSLGLYMAAFLLALLLCALALVCVAMFGCISRPAGKLMVIYLLWLCYAAYLNLGVALLN